MYILSENLLQKTKKKIINDSVPNLIRSYQVVIKKMANNSISYVPKYTPPEERCFLTYLDDIKYERFMKDPDTSLKNTKIINFDIIHHQCRGDELSKPIDHYQTVFNNDFKKYLKKIKKKL